MFKNLESLHPQVRPAIETFYSKLASAFQQKLDSVYLYGSIVTEDFLPEQSDVNSLILLHTFESADIHLLRPLVREGIQKRIVAPLCLAVETFERSADVFPLEFIEIQDKHACILGETDRVAALEIPSSKLRLKIEEQIKGKLIHLRGILLEHQGSDQKLVEILVDAQRQLFPVFRNLLRFLGVQKPPLSKDETLRELESRTQFTVLPCRQIWEHAKGRSSVGRNILSIYNEYIDVLLKLAQVIDRMDPE